MCNFAPIEFERLWELSKDHVLSKWGVGRGKKYKISPKDMLFMMLAALKHCGNWETVSSMFGMDASAFQKTIKKYMDMYEPFLYTHLVKGQEALWSMKKITVTWHAFANYPCARYATDVTFQPTRNFHEVMEYFSGKHRLYGHKVKVSVLPLIVGLLHEDPSHHLTVREASKTSKWVLSPNSGEFGWQVCFPSEEPSFYFHPFTRAEFEDILQLCDETLAADPPHIEVAGSLLGWTVHRASLTRRVEDGSIISHTRFTMRVACSLEELDSVIVSSSLDSWPLIWTPPSWGYKERKQVCCQVLQEFETDAYVLVHDIPGPIRSRYISLARRLPRQDSGKRSITYVMVIADSEAKSKKCTTDQENAWRGI
ncbi:hypothetical protein PPTG_17050 [Phytophthora nicotianae INRA-310]|uniref:DDE Tnp4 domain-containing protein n=1 Tax=Phytophthora nicotianae (strain INRA-310) TaxID=761204 RepID=W2PL56_PHYN3|nr:hypothetical protein PPTG_17050 [Phytophthora nicotianae INRA-310]ETN01592.1 hypothetical protein PPTG_17050 [Phytophthora nicotianae INRA-310]